MRAIQHAVKLWQTSGVRPQPGQAPTHQPGVQEEEAREHPALPLAVKGRLLAALKGADAQQDEAGEGVGCRGAGRGQVCEEKRLCEGIC